MNARARVGRGLALAAIVLAVTAPLAYVATLSVPALRRSPLIPLLGGGLALALALIAWRQRAPWHRAALAVSSVVLLGDVWWFAFGARLGADRAPALGARVPPFTALAHDGSTFDLTAALARGPVLLVAYRGFW